MGYEKLKAFYNEGNRYFEEEEYDEAIISYNKAIDAYGDVIKKYEVLPQRDKDNQQNKVLCFKALLNKETSYYKLGTSYYYKEEHSEATESYDKAIKVADELIKEYKNLLSKDKEKTEYKDIYFKALNSKGDSYHNLGKYYKAIELYNKVIKKYDENRDNLQYKNTYFKALNSKGDSYHNLGEYYKAIELYNKVIKKYDENKDNLQYKNTYFHALFKKGFSYSGNKDYNKAIESYNKFIEEYKALPPKDKNNPQYKVIYFNALNNKGFCYGEKGKYKEAKEEYKEAKEEYKKAIKADQTVINTYRTDIKKYENQYKWFYFYALNNQGFCYSKSKEYTESIDAYSKVITEYEKNKGEQYKEFYFYALRKLGVIYFNKRANIEKFKKIIRKYKILSKEGEIYFTEFCDKLENEYKQKCYTYVSKVIKHLDKQSKEYSNAKNTFNDLKKCISRNKKHLGKHSINAENYLKKSEQYLNELRKRFPIKTAATAFERQKIETIYSNCKIPTLNYIEDLNQIKELQKKLNIEIYYIDKPEDIVTYCTEEEKSNFVFRGMNRLAWELTTTLYRSNQSDQETILSNFKHEALNLSDLNFDHYEKIDWLSLMQHHGSPTQMLDWTQSFNIALFFALYDTEKHNLLNKGIPYIAALKYTEIENYEDVKKIIKNKEESKDFYLFAPKLSHKRAGLQRSLFTYHPNLDKQEMDLPEGSKLFIINPSLKDNLLQYLERNGISPITIYGDLDHFSENAKNPNSELLPIAPQARNIANNPLSMK